MKREQLDEHGAAATDTCEAERYGLAGEGLAATLADWLGVWAPSWAASVMVHAAVVVLMAFATVALWTPAPAQDGPTLVCTGVTVQSPRPRPLPLVVGIVPKVSTQDFRRWVRRTETKVDDEGRTIQRRTDAPPTHICRSGLYASYEGTLRPSIEADQAGRLLEVFGDGSSGRQWGDIVGRPGQGDGRIFVCPLGVRSAAMPRSIVYVIDRSGSMCDSIDYVKLDLKLSIGSLPEDTTFHVMFFGSGPPLEMPPRRLVAATDENKQLAMEFIDEICCGGETDPAPALRQALALSPDAIYMLTDGEFDCEVVDLVKQLNVGGRTAVNTIGFLYSGAAGILKTIAAENGGVYRFVSEQDLADEY